MTPDAPSWAKKVVQLKWLLMLIVGPILTGLFIYGISIMSVNVVLEDMFPFGHPFVKLHKEFGSQFGGASTILVEMKVKEGDIFNTEFLKKIKGVTDEITFRDEALSLLTASISQRKMKYIRGYSGGRVIMDGLMWPKIPETEEELDYLRENIFTSPLFKDVLVNDEGNATLIIAEMKEGIDYDRLFTFFMEIKDKYEDANTSIHMIGKPVLLGWLYSYRPQMMTIFTVSIGILIVFLFLVFRMWQGTLVPAVIAFLSAIWGLGVLGLVRVNLSPLLFVLVFLVGARALGQAIQMTQRYFEELTICDGDRDLAAARTMGFLFVPGFAAILTDMAGFAVCYLIGILLMQQLAIALTIWMATIFILAGLFAPILCSYLPNPSESRLANFSAELGVKKKTGLLDRINFKLAAYAMGRTGVVIIIVFILLYAFSIYRIPKVPIGDPTPGSAILWPDSVYNKDYAEINRRFKKAGADNYMVFFRGTEEFASKNPKVLQTFEALDKYMARNMPDVYGGSASMGHIVRKLNKEMHDSSPLWEFIPDDEALASSMIFLFQSKSNPGDLDRYADPKFYNSNILMFFKDHTEETIHRIRTHMKKFFEIYPKRIEVGEFLLAGGVIGMETALNEEIAGLHAKVDALVLGAIFLMCVIAYRSIMAGILVVIPLLLANLLAFAYMSYAGIGFTINTLPCSAVGVGVGVNFFLFIFSRMREEMIKNDGNWTLSVGITAQTATKGVVFTALSLILPLLAWYYLSDLKFQAQMGLLLSLLLGFNMLAALTLHPALIYRLKPRFIWCPSKDKVCHLDTGTE
ncbi:MAG: MMPL family transporter [Deltaproteobacteria bacterium]|nr:MMPL family transporter [Deltaproteobacteria bacterium]